jgi:hypothetical protein
MSLESTQPPTEMSTRNIPGWGVEGGRPTRKADNLKAICEPRKCGRLDALQSYGHPRPVTGIASFFTLFVT